MELTALLGAVVGGLRGGSEAKPLRPWGIGWLVARSSTAGGSGWKKVRPTF